MSGYAAAQSYSGGQDDTGDVLTAHDKRGNITTVYNLFDGREHAIQVTRLGPTGQVQWTQEHRDGLYEKAYATVMDSQGNLFIAGVRREYRQKQFLILKYDERGYLLAERVDDRFDCTAVSIGVDPDDNLTVSGVCRDGYNYPARTVGYDNDLARRWSDDYDGGGRNYLKGMIVDYQGSVSITVESVFGDYRSGSFSTRTVVYGTFTPETRPIANAFALRIEEPVFDFAANRAASLLGTDTRVKLPR